MRATLNKRRAWNCNLCAAQIRLKIAEANGNHSLAEKLREDIYFYIWVDRNEEMASRVARKNG